MSATELVTGSQMNVKIQCFISARIYENATETRVIIADIYELREDSIPSVKGPSVRRSETYEK